MKKILLIIKNIITLLRDDINTKYWSFWSKKFGRDSKIFGKISLEYPDRIEIGNRTKINDGCILNGRGGLKIGDDVHISCKTIIQTTGLRFNLLKENRSHYVSPVVIADGVWIGSGVIINPGVEIGENSVIGSGAVVTKSIEANSVAVGVPAKIIKKIT